MVARDVLNGCDENPVRVLIVDDDEAERMLLKMFLSRFKDIELAGMASDGAQAVEQCRCLQPHVVVMDYMMPIMDGLTATRTIRQQYPQIQVIIFSAYHGDTLGFQATETGAFRCLSKMAMRTELIGCIHAARSSETNPVAQTA